MTTARRGVVAAVSLLVAAGVWVQLRLQPEALAPGTNAAAAPAPDRGGDRERATVPAVDAAPSPSEPQDRAEREPPPPIAAEPWQQHPFEVELRVLVVDPFGQPVPGYRTMLAPMDGDAVIWPHPTDAAGRVAIRLATRRPTVQVDVVTPRGHRQLVTLQHGTPTPIALTCTSMERKGNRALRGPTAAAHLHPFASIPQSIGWQATTRFAREDLSERWLDFARMHVRSFEESGSRVPMVAAGFPSAADERTPLTVSVRLANGLPAEDEPVMLLDPDTDEPVQVARTDGEGRMTFRAVAGRYVLRAGGEQNGVAFATWLVAASSPTELTMQLVRSGRIAGRVVDPDGYSVRGAIVEWLADDGSAARRAETDSDGAFWLDGLPTIAGRLLTWTRGSPLPRAESRHVRPDQAPLLLQVHEPRGSLRFRLPAATPSTLAHVSVRQLATGLGWQTVGFLSSPENPRPEDVAWQLAVHAGVYELHLSHDGACALPLGTAIVADGVSDLGTWPLAAGGRARFDLPVDLAAEAIELVQIRDDFDVRLVDPDGLRQPVQLPAGEFAVGLRPGDAPVRWQRFAVRPGSTTTVRVAR